MESSEPSILVLGLNPGLQHILRLRALDLGQVCRGVSFSYVFWLSSLDLDNFIQVRQNVSQCKYMDSHVPSQ